MYPAHKHLRCNCRHQTSRAAFRLPKSHIEKHNAAVNLYLLYSIHPSQPQCSASPLCPEWFYPFLLSKQNPDFFRFHILSSLLYPVCPALSYSKMYFRKYAVSNRRPAYLHTFRQLPWHPGSPFPKALLPLLLWFCRNKKVISALHNR